MSPTALDSMCQCDARTLYEKHGAKPFNQWAAPAIELGAQIHAEVLHQHTTGESSAKARRSIVPTRSGNRTVASVAERILTTCRDRFPLADQWAVECKFAFYVNPEHTAFQRGITDYAPFTEGVCTAMVDLKTKGKVSPRLGDSLVSLDMHRQLFACAIACMCHSLGTAEQAAALIDGRPTELAAAALKISRRRVPELGTWDNPLPYDFVRAAIETAPLPEVWILIWDKDNDRPVWRAHFISRPALRAQLRLAADKAHTLRDNFDRPPAEWPRSFNCNEPWECPHKSRCTNDLADPPDASGAEYETDLALVRLGAK